MEKTNAQTIFKAHPIVLPHSRIKVSFRAHSVMSNWALMRQKYLNEITQNLPKTSYRERALQFSSTSRAETGKRFMTLTRSTTGQSAPRHPAEVRESVH